MSISFSNLKQTAELIAIRKALDYVAKNDPDVALPKLMEWVDRFDKEGNITSIRNSIRPMIDNPDNNWYQLLKSVWDDVDRDVIRTLLENVIINATILGNKKQLANIRTHDCNTPWAILMDPTSACNLNCIGCWAAEYGHRHNLGLETMDEIIRQAKEMGTHFFLFSGGEPLVKKKEIIQLCEMHSDCTFMAFTNGTLIDEAFAEDMLRVKNFVPAISVEGFEEETDSRRGAGTYQRVVQAMDILKAHKLPFAASVCYTSKNTDVIGSEAFFDFLVEKGAKMAWFFTYMPVGVGAPTDLLVSAEQRKYMYERITEFRKSKSLFTLDFWNDGQFIGGCIAGGRHYLHINAAGDIEPCAFIHYSDSNIHEKTLLEAYKSPLFQEYRRGQPFNENMLRPCPLLDNQGVLANMVHRSGAHSTDMAQPENVDDLCAKCKCTADAWQPVADEIWQCSSLRAKTRSTAR